VDVLACPRCDGRLEVIACITEPGVAKWILDPLGIASQAPPVARCPAAAEEPPEPVPVDEVADPIYDD
jgi:hypothetical protein